MTREELLKFIQTSGTLDNLSVIKRQQILLMIKYIPDDKLAEVEKSFKDLHEKQKPFIEKVITLTGEVSNLKQKAKNFLNKASEQKENVAEEEKTETLLKQI